MTTKHARDLTYAGPGEVIRKLGDCPKHLLRRYGGVGDAEIYNKGENSKQRVASHHWGGDGQAKGQLFRGVLNIWGHGHADQINRSGAHACSYTMRARACRETSTHNQGVSGTLFCQVPVNTRSNNAFTRLASLGYL